MLFWADYEFGILSLKKLGFKIFEKHILIFLIKNLFQKLLTDIPFDAELDSLQNGLSTSVSSLRAIYKILYGFQLTI